MAPDPHSLGSLVLRRDCRGCAELFEFEQATRAPFGNRLRSIRESGELSIAEVAEHSGYAPERITAIEGTDTPPLDLRTLVRLADALMVHRKDVVLLALGRFIVDLPPVGRPHESGDFPPERLWW